MSRHVIDQNHTTDTARRAEVYTRLDRIKAGEAGHPAVMMLTRRSRKGDADASRMKQFLRIERGYLT